MVSTRLAPPLAAIVAACLLIIPIGGCKDRAAEGRSRSHSGPVRRPPPYAVEPLLSSLRPGVVAELKRQMELKELTDLPYYDMRMKVDPRTLALGGKYVLYYLNRTGRPITALPLLLHANSPRELGGPPSSAKIKIDSARALLGPSLTVRVRRPTLSLLSFARPVRIGERIKIEVVFSGKLRRLPSGSNDIFNQALASMGLGAGGSGASDYGLLASGDGITTVASAYPMAAPFRRGSFDTAPPSRFGDLAYNDVSNFRVEVTVPKGVVAVTNLHDRRPRLAGEGTTHTAVGAANRDFVVVAGRGLRRASATLGQIRINSVYLGVDEAAGKQALETTRRSLDLFQRRYGSYPFRELDVAEATLVGGAGGVEFPGMVLIAGMLYRAPSRSRSPVARIMRLAGGLGKALGGIFKSPGAGGAPPPLPGLSERIASMDVIVKQLAEFTVAHEIAHQFFAGVVGSDCKADPAVDEPLAQFAAGEYVVHRRGRKEGRRLMTTNVKMNYGLYRMLGGKDLRAARPVKDFPTALSYAAIVYGKAPYFYNRLRDQLGKKTFDRVLRQAVTASRFKIIDIHGWIRSLERASGDRAAEVRRLARRWFFETHGDEDLGVDDSGDQVMKELMGQAEWQQLKKSLSALGMKPRDLFKMMMSSAMR